MTAVAHNQNAQLKVAWCCRLGKSARFSKLNLLLESQCFPRLRLGKHSNSWKTKFTVPLGTSYKVPVKIYLILTAGVTHLQCYSIVTLTLVTKSFPIGSVKFSWTYNNQSAQRSLLSHQEWLVRFRTCFLPQHVLLCFSFDLLSGVYVDFALFSVPL